MKFNKFLLIFWFIIILGFLLRIYGLQDKVYWYDEIFSLNFSVKYIFSQPFDSIFFRPVYYLILSLWRSFLGETEMITAFLSVIWGTLSIVLMYKIGRLLFDRKVGLISSFLFSINPYQIYYAREVTLYALLCFFVLLSILLFLNILLNNRNKLLLLLLITNVILILVHPISVLIVFLEIMVFFSKIKRIKYLKNYILLISIFFILHLGFFSKLIEINSISWIELPSYDFLWKAFEVFTYGGTKIGHSGVGYGFKENIIFLFRIITTFLVLLICFQTWKKRNDKKIFFLFLWLLYPILFLYVFSISLFPIYLTRYLIISSAAFYLIVSFSLVLFNKRVLLFFLTALFIAYLLPISNLYKIEKKASWKDIAQYVKMNKKMKDIIILLPFEQILPFWYYYKYDNKFMRLYYNTGELDIANFKKMYYMPFLDEMNFFSGINLNYRVNYKEFIDQINIWAKRDAENIWCIVSPYWSKIDNFSFIIQQLSRSFNLEEKKFYEFPGVYLYKFRI